MKALVIAQHHGSFLTLQSLIENEQVDEVVVLVPESQIQKYKTFPDKVFVDYHNNLKKFCKKNKFELYKFDAPKDNYFVSYAQILKDLKKSGTWVVLAAGAIYQGIDETKLSNVKTAFVRGRLFDKDKRLSMYHMIGLVPEDTFVNSNVFFLNLDMIEETELFRDTVFLTQAVNENKAREMTPMAIGRPDALVTQALSALECLRLRTRSMKSAALHYWMPSINRKSVEREYMTYPFDVYAAYAKKVKKLLPESTYNVIVENGKNSQRYRDLAELSL